jgi:hypothetical protein
MSKRLISGQKYVKKIATYGKTESKAPSQKLKTKNHRSLSKICTLKAGNARF